MGQRRNHKKILTHFELNKIENTIYWNLWDATIAVLRTKIIPLNTYIREKKLKSKLSKLPKELWNE